MEKKGKFKLVKNALVYTAVLAPLITFNGCAKEVECSIDGEHVHFYINNYTSLSRYIDSEKEYVGNFSRTNSYLPMTDDLRIIDQNKLCLLDENRAYLKVQLQNCQPTREAYVYDYVYGNYYGYAHGINPSTGNFEYFYGLHTGYHYDYDWKEISLDEYTSDQVRDITYQFKLYKINEDGSLSSSLFDSLEEVTEDYKYFRENDLIQKNVSESYFLPEEKVK